MKQSTPSGGEYDLGIDLGTTWTAAATREVGGPSDGEVRVVPLEARSVQAPSVVFVDLDGGLMVGSAAEDAAARAPERVVREFKRRLGDETPIVVAGGCFSADGIAAELVRRVADRVARGRGAPPRGVAVSHPAGWGAYRRGVFAEALAEVGLPDAVLLPEPEAAAIAHAVAGRIPAGHTAAVYDLGGGTFDATVVCGSGAGGVTVLGRGQGLEALGGIDFDEALFWHVCGELGGAVAALDPADPDTTRAVAGLRRACVAAKEALSADTEAVVPVELPGTSTRVRVTRSELEEMISPALRQTVDVLSEVLDTARVRPDHLDSVLLVGGSSRIPVVAQVLARALGRPVAADPDPTTAVARGAAVAACGEASPGLPVPAGSGPFPAVGPGLLATPAGGAPRAGAIALRVLRPRTAAPEPRPHPVSGPLPAPTAVTARVGALAAPRPAEPDVDDPDAPTVQLALPAGLRTATPPARPPVGAAVAAPAAPVPQRRRRLVAGVVGGGVLLAAAGVVATTVPMITGTPAGQSATLPLPAPAVAPPPAAAPAAPRAAPITSDVSPVAETRAGPDTTPSTRSSGRDAGPPAPAVGSPAPRAVAPAPPAAAPRAAPAPAPVKPQVAAPAPKPAQPEPGPTPPGPDPEPPSPDPEPPSPDPEPPSPDPDPTTPESTPPGTGATATR